MTPQQIGEFTGCTHGENFGRVRGCIPCAIEWHTRRQVEATERAEYHARMLKKLGDEQIQRKFLGVEVRESADVAPGEAVLVVGGKEVGRITGLGEQ